MNLKVDVDSTAGTVTIADTRSGDIGYIPALNGGPYQVLDERDDDDPELYLVSDLNNGIIYHAVSSDIFIPLQPGDTVTITVE